MAKERSYTSKKVIFTKENRKLTPYMVLDNSHHVGNIMKKYKIQTTVSLLVSAYPPKCLTFLISLPFDVLI